MLLVGSWLFVYMSSVDPGVVAWCNGDFMKRLHQMGVSEVSDSHGHFHMELSCI